LITGSLLVGASASLGQGEALPGSFEQPLRRYGDCIGRAFQIADDCLDLTGTAEELGKNPNADQDHDKLTWPAVVGLERSLEMARDLAAEAAALGPRIVHAAEEWRGCARGALAEVGAVLQDLAFAAVERRS
jgi:geranylgeranyl pyrophosphate synthase